MHKVKFALALSLGIGSFVVSIISFREGWLTNLSEFTTLVISGVVVGMVLGAGGLFYKSFGKSEIEKIPRLDRPKEPSASLLSPERIFLTELSPKQGLRLGSLVTFKATFRGEMKRGAFSTLATPPKGREFGIPCEKTFKQRSRAFLTTGKLNGHIDDTFVWHWQIPEKTPFGERTPLGEWTLSIRAYQRTPYRNWWVCVRIWIIVGLKRWIDAIDLRALDQPKWPWIEEKEYSVIIGPKTDTAFTRVNP